MDRFTVLLGVAVVSSLAVTPAAATPLLFQLTGSRQATFQLDTNPTPTTSNASFLGSQIQFASVAGVYGGTAGTATLGFGTGPILAQLNITGTSLGFTQFAGPDLFKGTAANPLFAPGIFNLTSIVSGASTLTISAATTSGGGSASVPEPSTLAIVATGLAILGYSIRRRA